MEPTYSIKEIMELQFKGIDHKLSSIDKKNDAVLVALDKQNIQTEKRFTEIEKELKDIKKKQELQEIENARVKLVWGIGATVGAALIAIAADRIF